MKTVAAYNCTDYQVGPAGDKGTISFWTEARIVRAVKRAVFRITGIGFKTSEWEQLSR